MNISSSFGSAERKKKVTLYKMVPTSYNTPNRPAKPLPFGVSATLAGFFSPSLAAFSTTTNIALPGEAA